MGKIEEFFDKKLITNHNTKKSYRTNINKYFRLINKDIDTYFNNSEKSIEEDLENAFRKLKTKGKSDLVIRTIFNSIKQYLCKMDRRLKTLEFWDEIKDKTKNASPVTDDDTPNASDIKQVLQHSNTRGRAMFLIQSCTGCRIGELIALYPGDFHLDEKPVRVTFKKSYDPSKPTKVKLFTKNNQKHESFLTDEAKESYTAYMKERDTLFKKAIKKTRAEYRPVKLTGDNVKDEKKLDEYIKKDKRVFPMSDDQARDIWARMVLKSGLYKKDSNTNHLTLHPHCLRKFFRSYLNNVDLAEQLMGHSGYLSTYRDMKKEDLGKEFLKYAHNVTIFETTPDLAEHTEKISKLEGDNEKLREIVEKMQMKMDILETKLDVEKQKNGKIN